jgi:hypothetical protein
MPGYDQRIMMQGQLDPENYLCNHHFSWCALRGVLQWQLRPGKQEQMKDYLVSLKACSLLTSEYLPDLPIHPQEHRSFRSAKDAPTQAEAAGGSAEPRHNLHSKPRQALP